MAVRELVEILIRADGSSAALAFEKVGDKAHAASRKIDGNLKSTQGSVQKLSGGMGGLSGATAVMGVNMAAAAGKAALLAGAGTAVLAFMRNGISQASSLSEETNKAGVTFGTARDQVMKFASGAAESLGMSQVAALQAANQFGVLFTGIGQSEQAAADMSQQMTQLAADMASFNNSSPEEAITAIGAALRGENEPIRRFGVLLDDATLRQQALKQGLIQTTSQALTPAQKAMAAYSAILEQTGKQQGDFARTSDSFANSQKTLKAQMDDAAAAVGKMLIPALTTMTQVASLAAEDLKTLAEVSGFVADNFKLISANKPDFSFVGDIVGPALGPLGQVWGKVYQGVKGVTDAMEGEEKARQAANDKWNAAQGSLRAFEGEVDLTTEAIKRSNEASYAQTQQAEQAAAMVATLGAQYDKARAAVEGYADAVLGSLNSELGLRNAEDAVAESVASVAEKMGAAADAAKNYGAGSKEAAKAQDEAGDAARNLEGDLLTVAGAALRAAEDQAELEGRTLSAKEKAEAQTTALQRLKEKFPQLAPIIDGYIGKINNIPASKQTTVNVTTRGVQEAESAISRISRERTAYVRVAVRGAVVVAPDGGAFDQSFSNLGQGLPMPAPFPGSGITMPTGPLTGQAAAPINQTINLYTGLDPQKVVDALRVYMRQSGPLPIKVAA